MRSLIPWLTLAMVCPMWGCSDDNVENATTAATGGGTGGDASTSATVGSGGAGTTATATTGTGTSSTGGAGGGGTGGMGSGGGLTEEVCAVDDGQCIFRHDTFGDEQLWTDALRLHELVQSVPPSAALGLGLKVDATAVPADVLANADLNDPATTVSLLELNAVVGVRAMVVDGQVERIGITCALCHSDVDDSVADGIGNRLDGWPNRDLDPGLIISLTPGLDDYVTGLGLDPAAVKQAYASWGPGYYDARFNQDGVSEPVLIPPAYGLADVALETYTGEGPISYWNAYVAVTQMGAHGNFSDPDIGIDIRQSPDLVTPKLPALADYQHSIEAPMPPAVPDVDAVERGDLVFEANCESCHSGDAYTDAPTLHDPSEVGTDETEATRSKTKMYRTTPLRGVSLHPPFFHDGSAATLEDVVAHYNTQLLLELTAEQQADLVAYLKSL